MVFANSFQDHVKVRHQITGEDYHWGDRDDYWGGRGEAEMEIEFDGWNLYLEEDKGGRRMIISQ